MNEVWRKAISVIKCNLGKVNHEAMLLGRFPSYAWGCPIPLAGHLVTCIRSCLLAVLRKVLPQQFVLAIWCCFFTLP